MEEDGGPRRSGRTRIPNRQSEYYELYMTVEEEEVMLANIEAHWMKKKMKRYWLQ